MSSFDFIPTGLMAVVWDDSVLGIPFDTFSLSDPVRAPVLWEVSGCPRTCPAQNFCKTSACSDFINSFRHLLIFRAQTHMDCGLTGEGGSRVAFMTWSRSLMSLRSSKAPPAVLWWGNCSGFSRSRVKSQGPSGVLSAICSWWGPAAYKHRLLHTHD